MKFSRRFWLGGCAAVAMLAQTPVSALAAASQPFDFNWLYNRARTLAGQDYTAPVSTEQEWLKNLGYDAYRDIRFRRDKALWSRQQLPYRVEYFHLGSLYLKPVQLHEVVDGRAQALSYDPDNFKYGQLVVPDEIRKDSKLGYAGLRMLYPLNRQNVLDELFVFLGASYFRALGKAQFYGLSARGLAIDTASAKGEEFPDFTAFWLERPVSGRSVTIYALLDSPSMTGAFRFVVTPGADVTMDVSARLFARKDIDKVGIAPLTSMYAHGENDNRLGRDFRPEVHDSDGLLMASKTGEWLWRPLINPAELGVSSYSLPGVKGFGLLQRDRNFDHYQDIEAHYEARPSLWLTPKGDWGAGVIQLVEIPTDSEIHDNIVAYWVPQKPVTKGQELRFDYRLSWGKAPAAENRPMEVVSTHIGDQFGTGATKFVIDFKPLNPLQRGSNVALQPDLWTSAGEIAGPVLMPNPNTGGWRMAFDLKPERGKVHELRCILRQNGKAVSETWSYQWHGN